MDEYQLEIDSLKSTLARLRADEAAPALIEEYELECRNLQSLYRAAQDTMVVGDGDPRIRQALSDLGFGGWTLNNVYAFVYDAAIDADTSSTDLAGVVHQIDFAGSLLAAHG